MTPVLLLFSFLAGLSAIDDGSALESTLERARAALAAGRSDAAVALLVPRLEDDRAAIGPLLLEAFRRSQRFDEGRALVARLDPPAEAGTPLIIAIAQWEAEEGWVRRATKRLDATLALRPEDGELRAAHARLCRALGDPRSALASADRAIAAGIDPGELAWLRGGALIELGRGEEADVLLGALVKANPGHVGARLTVARRARAGGDHTAAVEQLWEILELAPDHAAALGEIGSLLVRDPNTRLVGVRLLSRFRTIRDRRERIERLTRERREGRDTRELRVELSRLYRADDRPAVALSTAGFPESDGDRPADLLAESARALRMLGDPRAALERYVVALRMESSRADLRLELAETLLAVDDPHGAGTALERCSGEVDSRRWRLAEVERCARLGLPWERIAPLLLGLLREDPTDLEATLALVDAALAFEHAAAARVEFEAIRAEHPTALAPRLGLAWITLESSARGAADTVLEALSGELRDWVVAHPDADRPELWHWFAALHEGRGEIAKAESARHSMRRARAIAGPSDR